MNVICYMDSTAKRYKEFFNNIKKEIGNYKLSACFNFGCFLTENSD